MWIGDSGYLLDQVWSPSASLHPCPWSNHTDHHQRSSSKIQILNRTTGYFRWGAGITHTNRSDLNVNRRTFEAISDENKMVFHILWENLLLLRNNQMHWSWVCEYAHSAPTVILIAYMPNIIVKIHSFSLKLLILVT